MKSSQSQSQDRKKPTAPSQATVTVEDLLHFKRAERPPPEFWDDFEKQLKQRQLAAAIHERRSWLPALPELLRIALVIPASAAAALAIALIVSRNNAPVAVPATPATASAPAEKTNAGTATLIATTPTANPPTAPAAPSAPDMPADVQIAQTAAPLAQAPAAATITVAAAQTASEAQAAAGSDTTNESVTTMTRANAAIPEFARVAFAGARRAAAKNISPGALLSMPILAGNLPAIRLNVDDTAKNSGATPDTATTIAETLIAKTDDAANDPRHERMLSYIKATVTPASATNDNPRAASARNRVASRLNDKVLTDNISRFAATGDSFSIKF